MDGRIGARHSDVLDANPEGVEATTELVAELKKRGNAAFKNKSFLEAETLYTAAIKWNPNTTALYSNRCAARVEMAKFTDALEDGEKCVELKPDWSKSHFRVGQALAGLDRTDEALSAFRRVLNVSPADKAAKKEISRLKDIVEKRATLAKEKSEKEESKKKVVKKTANDDADDDDDDEELVVEDVTSKPKKASTESMKGYKILADGRKTSYFHREISAEEKAKLATHAQPKAIDASQAKALHAANVDESGGGSAWNAKGTFEERDTTKWTKAAIASAFSTAEKSDEDDAGMCVSIVEAKSISGESSVAFLRGKKRFIYDYNFCVCWTYKDVKGQVFLPDFSSDVAEDEALEMELRWNDRHLLENASERSQLASYLTSKTFGAFLKKKEKEFRREYAKQ